MPLDFNKLKKHEKYQEGTVAKTTTPKNIQNKGMLNNNNVQKTLLATVNRTDNNTMLQRVQARYENIMRQTVDSTPNVKNNVPNVNVSQQMNANAGTGMRSTAKTGSVNDGKLPTLNSMPNKYEENKNVSKGKDRGLLKDTKNIASNFGLGIKKAGESAMYYMEEMSNRNRDYRIRNKFMSKLNQEKEQQENLKNGKTLEGKDVKQTLFPNIESIKQQLVNQPTNAVLERAQEVQNLESPISEFLNKKMAVDEGKIQQNIDSSSNPVSKKIAELMPSIGQSTTGMAVSAVNPGLGLAFWQTSAGGDYIKDAKARGMKEEDALKYGTIMGAMESATEWVGGELTKGVGKAISKGGTIEGLKALGLDIGENFFEEAIMEPIQETVATMTGGKETADWNDMMKRVLQSGIDGALTSIIMGGASAGVGKATSLIGKMQSGEKITQQEIADTLKEINKTEEIDIEKVLARAFGVNIKNNNIEIQKQNGETSNLFIDKNSSANELQRELNTNKQLDNKMQNISSQIFQNEGMRLQNNEHLKDNQQITQPNNEIPQNANMEQIQQNQNNLANNQEMLYNNTESESGVNEQVQREGMEGVLGELRTRIYEETSQSKEYSRTEYEQWEKSITPTEENRITESERKIRDNVKGQYQKDIVFFDGTENDLYSGGASYQDKNKIHVDRKQAENFGLNKMVYHEILESDILHNERLKEDIIKPTIQKIMDDPNFENQKQEFWKNETDNMPSDYLIAKDILCDRFSELKTNEKLDYENMLSQESNMTIDYALENFHQSLYGKDIGNSNESSFSMQENITDMYREEMNQGKNRKHYKTVFESEAVGKIGKQASKELFAKDTYVPVSNQKTITEVNDNIGRVGVENSYIAFRSKIANNEKINLQDIATGERLIQIYSQQGDYNKVQDLIQDVAILGTELGQQVQALSLIKKMSPEGQLQYLNKLVERTNIKEKADIKVTDEMAKKILESKSQEDLENNLTEVAIQIGEQIPITRRDKIRSWRYLSMLGNPKTHIKNIGANVAMNITQNVKNTIAAGMEDAVSVFNKNMERTKTLKHSTDEQIDFARQDAEYMKDLIDAGGKYDIKNIIQNNKKQFDNKTLNAIAEFNSNALDVEDKVFLKLAYSQALANYMTANKLNPSDMAGKTLEKARQYASFQAQEATFHQFSALANSLNAIENRGGVGGKFVEAVLPFKKTPLNIAKAGVEYSPIGIAKSLTFDLNSMWNQTDEYKSMLEQGKITQEEYNSATSKLLTKQIDNMAKGLTGTSIAIIGYFLAQSGILKAGNDGEEDEFGEKMGKQEYSLQIGDSTYTLDWISPSAIPLFVGATVQQLLNSEEENKDGIINSALTAGAKAFEPMTEMSMLQNLTSAISSYEQGSSSMIFDLGTSAISSYVGQFVPTTLGQVARTMDPYERDTISTKKGMEKKVDQFVKQQMNKVPGLSQMLPIKQDVWGEDKKRDDNVGMRLLTNMILPYNRKKVIEDVTNTELLSVFEDTGEKGVLPGTVSKDLTINKEKYRLTAEEYKEAKKQFGSESKKILDGLIKSNSYKEMSPEQRAKAIENVYSYTKENMKKTYADNKKIELKTSNVYNTVKRIEDENGKVSSYFEFHSQIDGMKKDSEKMKCLRNITTDTKTKSIIYEEYLMNKPDEGEQTQYEKVKEDYGSEKIINQYLDYKVKANDKLEVLRATGKKKKTEGLTDVESINLLKEAGYDKYQNEALYTNMIASDKNKMVYQYLKKINKGNCIDDYMTYLTSDIAADKTDNGLKNGKTVTGSASKKKGEAINKTNLNELAKIYLYATSNAVTNKTRSSDYNKLANYVHSLPDKEQKEILKTISSAKETTTGSYYWK